MDILGKVKSAFGVAEADQQTDLLNNITDYIGKQTGGLNGFIQQFKSKGFGDVVSSWVGKGENLPISASQIQDVLGSDTIKGIATKMGIDTDTVTTQLLNLLPQIVDKLTPDGNVPEGNILTKGMEKLGELFGRKE